MIRWSASSPVRAPRDPLALEELGVLDRERGAVGGDLEQVGLGAALKSAA